LPQRSERAEALIGLKWKTIPSKKSEISDRLEAFGCVPRDGRMDTNETAPEEVPRTAPIRVRPFLENSTACTMFNANFIEPQLTSFGVGMDSFD
jgi:hypothetical protein